MQDPLINQIRKKQEEILKYEETNSECDDTQGNLVPILMSDYFKSFKQLVENNGFAYECHLVATEDGYLINLFRIQKREFLKFKKKPAALL